MNLNVSSRDPNILLELYISIFYRVAGAISLLFSTPLLYAIFFRSGKISRYYKTFLVAAQILNISHDVVYNFSFAPVMDQSYHALYSSGGLMAYLEISMSWQFAVSLFIRLQCAFCNFSALFYRHQIVQFPGSRWKFSSWKCILLAIVFNIFICFVFIPMNLLSTYQGRWQDIVRKEFLPGGEWLLEKPSILIVPRIFDKFFYIMGGYSLIASILSAVMFTMTAKLITKTLSDNRTMLSKTSKVQHTRAIAALRAQSASPLIFVTIPMNMMIFSNSIIPPLPWIVYVFLLGLPSIQSIIAALITIYFQPSYRHFFSRALNLICTSRKRNLRTATVTSTHHVNEVKLENVNNDK